MNNTADKFEVLLVNDGRRYELPLFEKLGDFSKQVCPVVKDDRTGVVYPVLAALVDHKLKELDFKLAMTHEVEFIGYNHPDGPTCVPCASCCRTLCVSCFRTRSW